MQAASSGAPDSDLLIDSAALSLHDFYVGLERLFEYVAVSVDGSAPSGPERHRELLRQMSVELPGLRPAVLAQDTVRLLDEFLRFRHVVHSVYAFELDVVRVGGLVADLPAAFARARSDLEAFAVFLESVGSQT